MQQIVETDRRVMHIVRHRVLKTRESGQQQKRSYMFRQQNGCDENMTTGGTKMLSRYDDRNWHFKGQIPQNGQKPNQTRPNQARVRVSGLRPGLRHVRFWLNYSTTGARQTFDNK